MARAKKSTKSVRVPGFSESPGAGRDPVQRLITELEARTEQLALINGVLKTVVAGASLPEILKVFASNLKTICPFDRCSISIYDPRDRVFLVPYMVMGGKVVETKEPPRPFSSSPLSKVVESGRPVLRNNIVSDKKHFEMDEKFLKKGFASEMLVPLQVGDKVFGTFNMGAWEADRFTEEHLKLITDIIPAIAVAAWHHVKEGTLVAL